MDNQGLQDSVGEIADAPDYYPKESCHGFPDPVVVRISWGFKALRERKAWYRTACGYPLPPPTSRGGIGKNPFTLGKWEHSEDGRGNLSNIPHAGSD
jgi:hypothetical protein